MATWNEDAETGADQSDTFTNELDQETGAQFVTTGIDVQDPSVVNPNFTGQTATSTATIDEGTNMSEADAITLASLDTVAGQQTALNYVGFGGNPPLAIDGDYGPLSKAATKRFQASRGLAQDAIWGPATKAAMFAAVQAQDGIDPLQSLLNNGLSQAQAVLVAANQANAPAAPSSSVVPSASDVQAVNASLQVSGGASSSLGPIPQADLPAQTPPKGVMQKVKDAYAKHPVGVAVGGGIAALLVGYGVVRLAAR